MHITSHIRRMIRLFLRREPSIDEMRAFTALAADASSLGTLLQRSRRIALDQESAVDLADGDEREILSAALRAGAAQHLRAGEDLLTLVERLNRMMEVSTSPRDTTRRADLGITLLRAIAIVDLLDGESRERYPSSQPLTRLAGDSARALAQGYVRALGAEVPTDLRRAFPRFARSVRDTADHGEGSGLSLMQRLVLGTRRAPQRERAVTEHVDAHSIT